MIVRDICNRQTKVTCRNELDVVLSQRRDDGANAFWLSHDGKEYPSLALLVKDELASATYFPEDRDAGYVPVGNLAGLPVEESTRFSISSFEADDLLVDNDAVLPTTLAMKLADEFFHSDALPPAVEWQQL
jgi:hypothetical protein